MARDIALSTTSEAFQEALDSVEQMSCSLAAWMMPEPTLPSVATGARAGRISRRTARPVCGSMARARR